MSAQIQSLQTMRVSFMSERGETLKLEELSVSHSVMTTLTVSEVTSKLRTGGKLLPTFFSVPLCSKD